MILPDALFMYVHTYIDTYIHIYQSAIKTMYYIYIYISTPIYRYVSHHYFAGKEGFFVPQIALAIGVLTSNRRGGWCTSSKIGRGAVAGCHCWAAIAGDSGGGGCTRWRIGRGGVAGCH